MEACRERSQYIECRPVNFVLHYARMVDYDQFRNVALEFTRYGDAQNCYPVLYWYIRNPTTPPDRLI